MRKQKIKILFGLCLMISAMIIPMMGKYTVLAGTAHVFDNAGLLTEEQEEALEKRIEKTEIKKGIHILITTAADLKGQSYTDYADIFYEKNNGGGKDAPGILFLIDMQHRKLYISTNGQAVIRQFSPERLDKMLDSIYDEAADKDYYGSCKAFLKGVDRYAGLEPGEREPKALEDYLFRLVVSVALGGIIVGIMALLRTGEGKVGTGQYFVAGASKETGRNDTFVRRTVTKRRIERSKNGGKGPGGGMGGGSPTHTSSSGTTHGGAGRSF